MYTYRYCLRMQGWQAAGWRWRTYSIFTVTVGSILIIRNIRRRGLPLLLRAEVSPLQQFSYWRSNQRESPSDIGGGGAGVSAWPFLFISQGRFKALFYHLRIGWKYLFQYCIILYTWGSWAIWLVHLYHVIVPKKRYWTAHFDVDPETAASSRVVAKSHSPRFQTSTKEQLLSILDDKDSKKPQASKRISDKDIWTFPRRERVG